MPGPVSPERPMEALLPPEAPDPFGARLAHGEPLPVPPHARYVLPSYDILVQAWRGGPGR